MCSSSVSSSSSTAAKSLATDTAATPVTDTGKLHISVDLVAAARRHLSFLRSASNASLLRHPAALLLSIRRYEDIWMPLIFSISTTDPSSPPMLLPPLDVRWIWLCHCLSPKSYRDYCLARFGSIIERPAVFDEENEEYASDRCREVWLAQFPSEPFDLEEPAEGVPNPDGGCASGELFGAVERHRDLWSSFRYPFFSETVYLVSARQRYRDFLHLCKRNAGSRLAPASDVSLMWMVHKSFPGAYWRDSEAMGMGDLDERIVEWDAAASEEDTRRLWEAAYREPYERAGAGFRHRESPSRVFFYWEAPEFDANREYKILKPRFLMEVNLYIKCGGGMQCDHEERMFLRLRMMRCNKEMKLEMPVSSLSSTSWQKAWQVWCEFGTQGLVLELHKRRRGGCLGGSKMIDRSVFHWIDVLRVTSLSISTELAGNLQAITSITTPVQAPYLLKCVPDRVTDDTGAMISDVILRMNGYRPQKGRWLSRTVLDQNRHECFVIRIRVAEGFWRRAAETPRAVKWEDRIIEVCLGAWSYVASSVGTSPSKVIGTAKPKEYDADCRKMTWCLSTGHLLTVQCQGLLNYQLRNAETNESIMLVRGRKLQYQPENIGFNSRDVQEEEEQYVTLIRTTPGYPEGKAMALINWRLFAIEFLPEEDSVLVLLLCTAIVRSISEMTQRDVGQLLLRRRVKEAKAGGVGDWGSVMLPSFDPHLQPWFWNADQVLNCPEVSDVRQPLSWYSAADGKEEMYKQVILGLPVLAAAQMQPQRS